MLATLLALLALIIIVLALSFGPPLRLPVRGSSRVAVFLHHWGLHAVLTVAGGAGPGTAANPQAQTVGRLPQTTQGIPDGGPFIRYAEEAVALAYSTAGVLFGAVVNLPLTAVPGFLRGLIVTVQASGGTGANVPTAAADSPWNTISQLTLRDASGQPMYPAIDGYGLFLINLYSGMTGQGGQQAPNLIPSFVTMVVVSGTGAGNFTFKLWVPLEYNSSAYCSLPADNLSLIHI